MELLTSPEKELSAATGVIGQIVAGQGKGDFKHHADV